MRFQISLIFQEKSSTRNNQKSCSKQFVRISGKLCHGVQFPQRRFPRVKQNPPLKKTKHKKKQRSIKPIPYAFHQMNFRNTVHDHLVSNILDAFQGMTPSLLKKSAISENQHPSRGL